VAGILYVLAVVAESAVGLGVGINQNDSAAKIASELADHRTTLLVVTCLCVVYAAMFPIYLWKLYDLFLRTDADGSRALGSLLLVGGVLLSHCMRSATLRSTACLSGSSRRMGLTSTRASPTRCT
jgi:hypothetical protein